MAARSPDDIKNIAFAGHGTCGKTSLIESLLHVGGAIARLGALEEGTTVCDYDEQEKERKHSLDLSCASVESGETLLQLLDTPGYRDFVGGFYNAVAAVDCVAVVVAADEGVRPNTRKVWEAAQKMNLPCVVVINRLDREHAD